MLNLEFYQDTMHLVRRVADKLGSNPVLLNESYEVDYALVGKLDNYIRCWLHIVSPEVVDEKDIEVDLAVWSEGRKLYKDTGAMFSILVVPSTGEPRIIQAPYATWKFGVSKLGIPTAFVPSQFVFNLD